MDKRFCSNCGSEIEPGLRFCSNCGADTQPVVPHQQAQPVQPAQPYQPYQPAQMYYQPKKKSPAALIIIIVVLALGILITGAIFLIKYLKLRNPGPGDTSELTSSANVSSVIANPPETAVVSTGVRVSDLGNILNGQYYFATDDKIFYSSFDVNDQAHIYSANRDGGNLQVIFDGFGWSLVVIDDWLYFSGNQGAAIDGTYNIFRMKFDGSQIERLNDKYSYGMFLYDTYLYYMTSSDDDPNQMSVCRSALDGSNKEVIFPHGVLPLVYKNKLFYIDYQGNMYRTEPDGTAPEVLLTAAVKTYVLSGEKIIYNDPNDNIYVCDLDGGNNTLIRGTSGIPINSVNAYNGRIFFSEYDTEFNYTAYGYNYTVKSCNMDGSDEREVFSSVSYGIYMNLVDDKLMMMDYTMSSTTSVMNAVVKVMNFDGSAQGMLGR